MSDVKRNVSVEEIPSDDNKLPFLGYGREFLEEFVNALLDDVSECPKDEEKDS